MVYQQHSLALQLVVDHHQTNLGRDLAASSLVSLHYLSQDQLRPILADHRDMLK